MKAIYFWGGWGGNLRERGRRSIRKKICGDKKEEWSIKKIEEYAYVWL